MTTKKLGLLIGTMAMVAVLPLAWPRAGSDAAAQAGGEAIPGGDGQGLINKSQDQDRAEAGAGNPAWRIHSASARDGRRLPEGSDFVPSLRNGQGQDL